MKIIYVPPKPRREGPKPPPWWRKIGLRTGTIVLYDGECWELIVVGSADTYWREWVPRDRPVKPPGLEDLV